MLERLDVPFRDAAAADLRWSLLPGAVAPPALARLRAAGAGRCTIDLHVLGASHAVVLTLPGGARWTETVACGVERGRALDAAPAELVRDGLTYRFASHVERHAPADVAPIAAELRARLVQRDDALFAAFPGEPGAATALRATGVAGGAGWETWHLYPERGEVVRTSTTVLVPAAADPDGTTGAHAPLVAVAR